MESSSVLRAVNSSSKLSQRQKCPGSAHAEKNLPRVESPYSEEGTLLHRLDANQDEPRGELINQQQREVLERNESLRQQFLDRELPRLGISPDAKVVKFVEREFLLCDFDGEPLISHGQKVPGHPDLIYWYPDFLVAIIFDSKFGRIEVSPAWLNLQLKSYFVMFCENFSPETVIVAITQPWAKASNDFHSAEYSAKDLAHHKQELIDIVRATEPENAPRYASIEACTYCLAVNRCPIAITSVTETAVVKVNDLTPEQLEEIGPEIKLAELVIEHWYKRMKYIANETPDLLTRYELRSTGSVRSVPDTVAAFRQLASSGIFGNPATEWDAIQDRIIALCKLSLSGVEEAISQSKKMSSKDASALLNQTLGDLIVSFEKEKSLVKKSKSVHTEKPTA